MLNLMMEALFHGNFLILIFASSVMYPSLCQNPPNLLEPLQNNDVVKGGTAEFICVVSTSFTHTYSFIWFVQDTTTDLHRDIPTEPEPRVVPHNDILFSNKVHGKYYIFSTTNESTTSYHIEISNVTENDAKFKFNCVASAKFTTSRTILSDWVDLKIRIPSTTPVLPSILITITEDSVYTVGYETTNSLNDKNNTNIALSGGLGGGVVIIFVVILIGIVCCISHRRKKSSARTRPKDINIITTSDTNSTSAYGIPNEGFLKATPECSVAIPSSLIHKEIKGSSNPSPKESPIYALPEKRNSKPTPHEKPAPGKKKSVPEEIPTYAKPDKSKITPDEIHYALPDKRKTVCKEPSKHALSNQSHDGQISRCEYDPSILYADVPVENDQSEDINLAYSVVPLGDTTAQKQARNVEGLTYADVDLPTSTDTSHCPFATDQNKQMAYAYSAVKFQDNIRYEQNDGEDFAYADVHLTTPSD